MHVNFFSFKFLFNTVLKLCKVHFTSQVADLYGIRASLVDGGEIRGAGNAWICPEVNYLHYGIANI